MCASRTSFEAGRDRCFCTVDDDDDVGGVVSLVTEWDRNFGVVMGESEGDLGESRKSERCAGVFCVFFLWGRNDLSWSLWWNFSLPLD